MNEQATAQSRQLNLRPLVASTPGGSAPQFRVQIQSEEHCGWQMIGTFVDQEIADHCAMELQMRGIIARVVAARIFPVAA